MISLTYSIVPSTSSPSSATLEQPPRYEDEDEPELHPAFQNRDAVNDGSDDGEISQRKRKRPSKKTQMSKFITMFQESRDEKRKAEEARLAREKENSEQKLKMQTAFLEILNRSMELQEERLKFEKKMQEVKEAKRLKKKSRKKYQNDSESEDSD
jgi:hypothetical protein